MKVLYSTGTVVQFDGNHYYNNAIQSTYRRYLVLGDEVNVICHMKKGDRGSNDMIDEKHVSFTFVRKVNTFKIQEKVWNDVTNANEVFNYKYIGFMRTTKNR